MTSHPWYFYSEANGQQNLNLLQLIFNFGVYMETMLMK